MLEDVNNKINLQANLTSKLDEANSSQVNFKGNPNAVDTTPTADTFQQQPVKESSMLRTGAYLLPTWYGLNKGADLFNKACGGEYDKSLMGKLGRLGDRISNSRLVNNSIVDKLQTWWNGSKVKTQAFIDKHPMLSAMQKTPTEPENPMPKAFMETQNEADIKEATAELEKFLNKGPKTLKEAGATKDEINALKAKYGKTFFGNIKNEQLAVQEFQLRKLGGDALAEKILKHERNLPNIIRWYEAKVAAIPVGDPARAVAEGKLAKLQLLNDGYRAKQLKLMKFGELGLSVRDLEHFKENPLANAGAIEAALERSSVVAPKLTQSVNKLKSMRIPTSKIGKLLPKLSKLGMRGMTFGGGLINTAFIAFPLASSIRNTVDAPKEKKAGTLAEGIVDAMAWIVSMPLALLGMHSVNGIKNTGLSKAQYDLFKAEQKAFNLKAKAGGFASLAEWTAEKSRIEGLKAVSGKQSLFTRGMKKIASFLSIGLEQFRPYQADTSALTGSAKRSAQLGNLKRWMPNVLKNVVGYPLRFALYMFAFAPVVDKLMTWGTKAIFGEAYDPEKIKEENEKIAQRQAELYPGPRFLPNPYAVNGLDNVNVNELSNNNLIKQKLLGVKPDAPQQQAPTYNGFNAAPEKIVKGEPIMPPNFPQQYGQQPQQQTGGQNIVNGDDPNVSVNDNVPRSYTPTLDINAPVPYHNPMDDPNNPKSYKKAQELIDKAHKILDNPS